MARARWRLPAPIALAVVVAASFVARVAAARPHSFPRYFPDEYLYTELARSFAEHARPLVRGDAASFPGLLEPLLAAPLQAIASPETAYRLTQAENALFMSLAAIPVYLLARRLSLSSGYALACALFAVAIPDLLYVGYTLADPLAYPLALGALAAALAALDRPALRPQVAFLALAALATLARVQFVVFPAAFVVAALVVDRRRALRTQRLPFVAIGAAALAVAAVGTTRIFGFYSGVDDLFAAGRVARWATIDLYLIAIATGVVLVPGAVVALARPRGRTEVAFSALTVFFGAGILLEAALFPRFMERYLFVLLPLVPVAFGLYLRKGRPAPRAVALVAVALFIAAARVPLSGYSASTGKTDSAFLFAVARLEEALGVANASLAIALLAAVAAAGAVAVARYGGGTIAVAVSVAVAVAASIGATSTDRLLSRAAAADYAASSRSWVDDAGVGDVTLLQTAGSSSGAALQQLYWNRSLKRVARLGAAEPPDRWAAPRARVAGDGTIRNLGRHLLVDTGGSSVRFANARRVAAAGPFTLAAFASRPRLRVLAEGRGGDGWLGTAGRFTVWPSARRGTISFALSLPADADPVTVRVGRRPYRIEPGRSTQIRIPVEDGTRWSRRLTATGASFRNGRIVSARSTMPTFTRR